MGPNEEDDDDDDESDGNPSQGGATDEWLLLPSDSVRYYAGDHRRRDIELNDHLLSAGGSLYVCIHRHDLAAGRFDRSVTVYQQT